jgi:hypothetical protein
MAMAAMNMVSAGGFLGAELLFKKMSAGGRLCTWQENPHFWVPTIKVRPPDGTSLTRLQVVLCTFAFLNHR